MPARTSEDCDRLFAERANAGDVEGVLDLYEEEGALVTRDGVARGRDAIRPFIRQLVGARGRLTCNVTRVVPAGEGLALLYNEWTLKIADADGREATRAGRALELVRRQTDGTWRFVVDDPYGRS